MPGGGLVLQLSAAAAQDLLAVLDGLAARLTVLRKRARGRAAGDTAHLVCQLLWCLAHDGADEPEIPVSDYETLRLNGTDQSRLMRRQRLGGDEERPTGRRAEWMDGDGTPRSEFPGGSPGAPVLSRRLAERFGAGWVQYEDGAAGRTVRAPSDAERQRNVGTPPPSARVSVTPGRPRSRRSARAVRWAAVGGAAPRPMA